MTYDGIAGMFRNIAQALATEHTQSDYVLHPTPEGDPEMTTNTDDAAERDHLESQVRRARAGASQANGLAARFRALAEAQAKLGDELRALGSRYVIDQDADNVIPQMLRRDPMKYELGQTLSRIDRVVHDAHARGGIWAQFADELTTRADRIAVDLTGDQEGKTDA